MINDYFLLAFKSIRHRKLRSWLTILGIVIGVAAIVALISLSLVLQATIEEQFEAFGADRLLIAARGFQGPGSQSEGITDDDISILERMNEFKTISYGSARPGEAEFKNEVKFPSIFGGKNRNIFVSYSFALGSRPLKSLSSNQQSISAKGLKLLFNS